jgi:cupin fold WbuC family metalloprotein
MEKRGHRYRLFTDALYGEVLDLAKRSERKRMNHNFHSSMEENPHRFLNVLVRGTYITPHRHQYPPKTETFLILEGRIAFFIFDDSGEIAMQSLLSPEPGYAHGIDIDANVWHTLAVLTDHAVCFEVKPGPYVKTDDKEFAQWAPREGQAGCGEFLEKLLISVTGEGQQ